MTHHEAALRNELKKDKDPNTAENYIDHLKDHKNSDIISDSDKDMLDYALKLTLKPSEMTEDDVVRLKDKGFDDRALHDICAVTAYFNFVNRMADGLGVELES